MFSLIPIMFIAGMVVQLKKTGQGRDHREGKRKQQEKQSAWSSLVIPQRTNQSFSLDG